MSYIHLISRVCAPHLLLRTQYIVSKIGYFVPQIKRWCYISVLSSRNAHSDSLEILSAVCMCAVLQLLTALLLKVQVVGWGCRIATWLSIIFGLTDPESEGALIP